MTYNNFIIDTMNYYYRTYYSKKQEIKIDGQSVNLSGITGFINFIKWIEKNLVKTSDYKIHICLDTHKHKGGENKRKLIDPEYKSNRETKGDEFYFGLDRLIEILLNYSDSVILYGNDGFEADDFVPKIIKQELDLNYNCNFLLCSNDGDWSRLISNNVSQLSKGKIVTPEKYFSNNGFYPSKESICLWKSLKSDTSDNIKSPLARVFKEDAIEIIDNCKNYDDVLIKLNSLKIRDALKKDISLNINKLKLNYKLVDFLEMSDYEFETSRTFCKRNNIIRKELYKKLNLDYYEIEPELLNEKNLTGNNHNSNFFEDEKLGWK